jgi:hypothetical protein
VGWQKPGGGVARKAGKGNGVRMHAPDAGWVISVGWVIRESCRLFGERLEQALCINRVQE